MNGAFAPDIMEYERKEKVGYMSGAVKKRLLSLLLAVSMIVGNTGQVLAQESAVVSEETAKKVVITSLTGNQYSWYYTGNITLKTDTDLKNLTLCPMKGSNKGTVSSINAGKFNLSLEDVFVGNLEGMGIKNHPEIGKK